MIRDREASDKEIKESLEAGSIGRNSYINNLVSAINSIRQNTIIALDGDWGSGKTYFVRSLKYLSEHDDKFPEINVENANKFRNKYDVFYFNAWQNDDLVPLESVLLRMAQDFWGKREELADMAITIARGIIETTVKYATNGNMSVDDFKRSYLKSHLERTNNIISLHKKIDDLISNYFESSKRKILFIIDDLDRCNPTYAVKLLETIKHNFTNENVIFIICANNSQLQHTIKKYYGESFNGLEYLNRFYDITIRLPRIDAERYLKYRCVSSDLNYIDKQVAINIADYNQMSLRQINRYYSNLELLDFLFEGAALNHEGKIGICTKFVFIPLATALKILNLEDYESFISGKGEELLKSYISGCEQIALIDKENNSEKMVNCYKELFKESSVHYQCLDVFRKATSLLGYVIEIDSENESPVA